MWNFSKAKSEPQYVACKDGKRKSKCPCLRMHKGCDETCSCVNCGNIHQAKPEKTCTINSSPRKRVRTTPIVYKRTNSANYLSERGTKLLDGSWTTEETCLLMCVISLIGATTVSPTAEHTTVLYNNVVNSTSCQKANYLIRKKTKHQIQGKLKHLEEKQNLAVKLAD